MNTCIVSSFTCSFDDFTAMVENTRPEWSQFVDDYRIAKIDEHQSVMLLNVTDFEAMGALMTSDEMNAWDAENGCVDVVYSMSEMTG